MVESIGMDDQEGLGMLQALIDSGANVNLPIPVRVCMYMYVRMCL